MDTDNSVVITRDGEVREVGGENGGYMVMKET